MQRVVNSWLTSSYFKLADIKLESSKAYLMKLGKNLSNDFEVTFFFCKNAIFNKC